MDRSNIHRAVTLLSPWLIRIGDNVNIQMGCFLDGRGGLTIGNNVDVTPGYASSPSSTTSTHPTTPR